MSEEKILQEMRKIFDEKLEQTGKLLDEKLICTEKRLYEKLEQTEKGMNERFDRTDQSILLVDRRLRSVELTIENEVNKKISFVAEGHLDLSRKLDEAMRIEQEKEMLSLRLVSMEGEIRRIKEKIS